MGKLLGNLKRKMNFRISTSSGQRDYCSNFFNSAELLKNLVKACMVTVGLAYFFYRSIIAVLPLSLAGILYFRNEAKKNGKQRRENLAEQFKECILSVTTSLKSGYAVENAFMESRADMKMLFGEHSMIYEELEWMRRGMIINITLEDLLEDLAHRSGVDEIRQFAQIFLIAKRSGGNLSEIIKTSADLISRRIETGREIRILLSGRRMELNIMRVVPFGILLYIGFTYPGYFDNLYHNFKGVVIMTVCLIIYGTAYFFGDLILDEIEKKIM